MHPFGSLLMAKELLGEGRPSDAEWQALHRRPDAPPIVEPATAAGAPVSDTVDAIAVTVSHPHGIGRLVVTLRRAFQHAFHHATV